MKIVAVLGSPRLNGNSATIAQRFLDTAKGLGAETQSFALNTLSYRGCQACYACKKSSETCVLKDDLAEVLDAVREADVLVLASPVYYADVTGQMKTFIDRMFCFLTPDYHSTPNHSRLSPGKAFVFIQTQGMADSAVFDDVFTRYKWVMDFNGIKEAHLIRACGVSKRDDIRSHEDVLKQAEALAVQITSRDAPQGKT